MSLFLVYFEYGKSVPISPLPSPLCSSPLKVEIKGKAKPRTAITITDGIASDHFLRFGKKVADRQGAVLRQSLFDFLGQRLAMGAHPFIVFIVFHGLVETARVDMKFKSQVSMSDLDEAFKRLLPDELIEVVADIDNDTGKRDCF